MMAASMGWDSMQAYPFSAYGIQALAKGGDITTYHASLVVLPAENMAAVVLSAGGDSVSNQFLANALLMNALQAQGRIPAALPQKSHALPAASRTQAPDMPAELQHHAGRYADSGHQFEVSIGADGRLRIEGQEEPFHYAGHGEFLSADGSAKIAFVEESNGRVYLWERRYDSRPGLGQMASSEYRAERLEANPLAEPVAAAWEARDGQRYYSLKRKYNSDAYLYSPPVVDIALDPAWQGYWDGRKILAADLAVGEVQIPGAAGRETVEAQFFEQDGVEYLRQHDDILISARAVPQLKAGRMEVRQGSQGQARWYRLSPAVAGRTLVVEMPAQAAFAVYDGEDKRVHYSLIDGNAALVLPGEGVLVLAGQPDAHWSLLVR